MQGWQLEALLLHFLFPWWGGVCGDLARKSAELGSSSLVVSTEYMSARQVFSETLLTVSV
ncbi:hypothetical protein ANAPRD1_01187 [Anaplasma phagocytophilum]|nr:hypothetical protein ANAPRD1_01187 [Anaplasma phagocytophilum]